MNSLNMPVWKNYSEIEQQLLSNDMSPQGQRETELLFGVLRHARNEPRRRIASSAPDTAVSGKGIFMGLLYAGGLLGRMGRVSGAWSSIAGKEKGSGGLMNPTTEPMAEHGPYTAWSGLHKDIDDPGPVIVAPAAAAAYRERRETARGHRFPAPDVTRQNNHIARLLNLTTAAGHGEAQNRSEPDNPYILVKRAAGSLAGRPEGLAKMAFTLLQGSGLYGASPGEKMTQNVMHKIVNDWSMNNLFGSSVETFVVRQMADVIAAQVNGHRQTIIAFDIKTCRDAVFIKLLPLQDVGTEEDGKSDPAYQYVLDKIIAPSLPTLFFAGGDSMEMGTLDWCYLHIGLAFAAKNAVDIGDMAPRDVIEIGCSISAMLMMGSLPAGVIELFGFPAVLHYLKSGLDKDKIADLLIDWRDEDIKQIALQHFFSAGETREYAVNPFRQFGKAISGYKSRTELAKEILTKLCGELKPEEFTTLVENYKTNAKDYHCPSALHHNGHHPSICLPDLNQAFDQQNEVITAKFAVIDRLMILDVMAQLPEDEKQFLTASTIRTAGADFSRLDYLTGLPEEYFINGAKPAVQLLPGIDLFLASTAKAEHIFALGRDESGYWLKRIDRRLENYFPLMKKNVAGEYRFYRLNIYSSEGTGGVYKTAGKDVDALCEALVALHGKKLSTQLYIRGYEETTREAFNHFMLSFIPFYHCAAWDPHRREQALISCVTDGLTLVPLASQVAGQSMRILLKTGLGGAASLRAGAAGLKAGYTVGGALNTVFRTFVELALVSASEELDRQMLTGLLLDLARAFDPGIEAAGMLGQAAFRQARQGLRLLRNHSPSMEKFFLKMDHAAPAEKLPVGPEGYTTARLAGLNDDIPIVMLGGDRYLDQPVYARISPHTGDVIGKKYTLSADNQLAAIPTPAAVRLKNILSHGLSGRGASAAARVWQQQQSIDTLSQVHLNGVECTAHISRYGEPGGEHLLFPEQGIPLAQESLDIDAYVRMVKALPARERMALRFWTWHNEDSISYIEGSMTIELTGNMPSRKRINENLWHDIPVNDWQFSDKHSYLSMVDLIKRPLPRQSGNYLGMGQYPLEFTIPWGESIGPGDIVTNYPTFLTVHARDLYAKKFTALTDGEGLSGNKHRQALLYFKIENGRQCIPLLSDTVTADGELTLNGYDINLREYLYPPNTFFRVKSIATAYMIEGEMHPAQRIGVVLEELTGPVNEAKNIYTGESVPVTSEVWTNMVKRYHSSLL